MALVPRLCRQRVDGREGTGKRIRVGERAQAGVPRPIDDDGVESAGTDAEPVGVGGGVAEAEWSVTAGVPFEHAVTGIVGVEVSAGVGDSEATLVIVGGCGGVDEEYILVWNMFLLNSCPVFRNDC